MKKPIIILLLLCVFGYNGQAQHMALRQQIDVIARAANGKLGVAVNLLETGDTLTYQNNSRYVLHSVFKLPIAMLVLSNIDKGRAGLNQKIHVTKQDLPETYSPLRDENPQGNIDVSIAKLLSYMVSKSDNDACDILLKHFGGPAAVNAYVHKLGIKNISIQASEAGMASAWPVQYNNWAQPWEIARLLEIVHNGTALSKTSNAYLKKMMLETSTGPKRLKGLLPTGTPVAHKTGTSGTNKAGITAATNDVGIITLPNGKHLAIAVFLTDSTEDATLRELVIAQIAKAAFDEFSL